MLDQKQKALNSILISILALFVVACLTMGIVYASLTIKKDGSVSMNPANIQVAVTTNTITVTNEVPCVLRVAPKTETMRAALATDTTNFTEQFNGWFYYNSVLAANSTGQDITLTGASATNISAEVMQAQYDANVAGGFLWEWGNNAVGSNFLVNESPAVDGEFAIFIGDTKIADGTQVNDADAGFSIDADNDLYKYTYTVNSVENTLSIDASHKFSIYNNSNKPIVFTYQIISQTGETASAIAADILAKSQDTTNANWTATTNSDGYSYNIAIQPGCSFDLIGSTTTLADSTFRMTISILDVDTFYRDDSTNRATYNSYYAWLYKLGGNTNTYVDDYRTMKGANS